MSRTGLVAVLCIALAVAVVAGAAGWAAYATAPPVVVTRTITVTQTVQAKPEIIYRTRYRTRRAAAPAPAPAAVAVSPRSYGPPPAGYPVPSVNGATWWVLVNGNVPGTQLTTLPGAGPGGSTCGQPVASEQVCVGGP